MHQARKPCRSISNKNANMYMDLKDILRENALRFLPAKSLYRFNGVCRDWKLHISTPFFLHNQSNSFRGVSGLFCQSDKGLPTFISLDSMAFGVPDPSLKFLPELVNIKSSSNGLLCCQGTTGHRAYYICNPVTKQWKKLPKPSVDHGSDSAIMLIYEPSLLNFAAEYKLVCAFQSDLDGLEFDIYSSAQDSWRLSGEICFGNRQIVPSTGVYAGGVAYWRSGSVKIVAFDVATERSTLLNSATGTLTAVDGKLCFACVQGNSVIISELSNAYTNTMQMGSRTNAWTTKKITLKRKDGLNFDVEGRVMFFGDVLVTQSTEKKCISYNLKTEEIKELGKAEYHERMFPYVNSLVEI
ncbi:F-box/kelch-repeat protein At3g17530-like [Mercurialis annua]|uniref:F-box/kelch-repeat protein At3g17530-like n=1 Tax=Mercurialis annua TaxID=3986 RepID=UPI00215F6976|nr:F-box/kelch-repeat protein At3g17530-like [Mercurialis annua]